MKPGFFAGILSALLVANYAHTAEWNIDRVHSSAIFKVHHLGAGMVYGAIPDIAGNIQFDPANPNQGSVEVTIRPESLNTFNPGRDNHLKGPDFFNAKEFPAITFKSSAWKKTGDNTYEVTGDFTMLGKTQTITVPVTHTGIGKHPRSGNDLIGFETRFTIDRTDFGMNYGVAETGGLGKDVTVIFAVEAGKTG